MALPEEYDILKISISRASIIELVELANKGRLVLLDGDVDGLFPNIHIRTAEDGHTFSGSMTIIDNSDGRHIHIGDVAYLRRNLLGPELDGKSIPQSLGAGSIINRVSAMQDVLDFVNRDIDRVIIGHEPDSFNQFKSKVWQDGFRVAFIKK